MVSKKIHNIQWIESEGKKLQALKEAPSLREAKKDHVG
jgi:hypothetical protein